MANEKVLVVSDDTEAIRIIRETLVPSGYEVDVVSNSAQALILLETRDPKPDLVILDEFVPGNYELRDNLERGRIIKEPPGIILIKGCFLSVTPPLPKPFCPEAFAFLVRVVLAKRHLRNSGCLLDE